MTAKSNLPAEPRTNDKRVTEFFDTYFSKKIEIATDQYVVVQGFFEKRGFEESAAKVVASVLIQQAKIDGVKVFEFLDTLAKFTDNQLSDLVIEILNHNRTSSSTLGSRNTSNFPTIENRNILI
jgi:hypothetical protein